MIWPSLARVACGAVLCALCLTARAEPRSRLIADYDAFLASMAADIEKIVDAEFRDREEDLKLLAQPFKMKTQVKVRYFRGPHLETVTGTLLEVNINSEPMTVRIGDRRIAYRDIVAVDQKRLFWATQANQERLIQIIEQMRAEIEAQKERLRTVERNKRLDEAGYNKEWFAQVVKLNGEFRPRRELGDHAVSVEVYLPDALPVARIRLRNETDQPSAFVAFFKQKRIGTNAPLGSSTEVPDKLWAANEFWVDKADLAGDDVVAKFTDRRDSFRLLMLRTKVGQWVLLPELHPDHRPLVHTVNTQVCPECFGAGKIAGAGVTLSAPIPPLVSDAAEATPTAAAADATPTATPAAGTAEDAAAEDAIADAVAKATGQAVATTAVCGTCLGKGTIMTEAPVKERFFFFRMMLAPSGMTDYTQQVADTFGRQAFGTRPYQQHVTSLVSGIQAKARTYRQENEAKLREEQEARRKLEEERRRQIENQVKIEQRYDWRTPEQLRRDPMDRPYRATLNLRMDDLLYPTKLWDENDTELAVEKMTVFMSPRNGVELQSRERFKIFAMLYRVLKAVQVDGTPRYYLQYLLEVDNSYAADAKRMQVALEFVDKNEPPTSFKLNFAATLRPTWNGHVGALVRLTADQVMGGLADASVAWAESAAPSAGTEAPKAGTEAPKEAAPVKEEAPLFP